MRPSRPRDARQALRRRLIAARLARSEADGAEAGAAILARLESRFPPGSLGLVGGYWPIRGEVDCRPYLLHTIEAGGAAALPVVTGARSPLVFRPWTPETPLEAGPWDTWHPTDGPSVAPAALLIPLVGFDAAGHRLGYGGGFYDRTLAVLDPRPLAIGVGFEAGRLASIDPGPHDHPMDVIVTEAGVFELDNRINQPTY